MTRFSVGSLPGCSQDLSLLRRFCVLSRFSRFSLPLAIYPDMDCQLAFCSPRNRGLQTRIIIVSCHFCSCIMFCYLSDILLFLFFVRVCHYSMHLPLTHIHTPPPHTHILIRRILENHWRSNTVSEHDRSPPRCCHWSRRVAQWRVGDAVLNSEATGTAIL